MKADLYGSRMSHLSLRRHTQLTSRYTTEWQPRGTSTTCLIPHLHLRLHAPSIWSITFQHFPALTAATVLTAVSDGSVDPTTGAAGYSWIIAAPKKAGYMMDGEPIRSDPRTMTSYRAELHGIYKLLSNLHDSGHRTKTIELWCDSESAIDLLNDKTELTPEDLTKAEGDLLTAIKRILRSFPTISLKHVRGHQLRHTEFENLYPLKHN